MHVHLAQKFIWKLQLIGRHTLTFLSRLLSNIWPQNLIFLRVSLRSPTSYLVQQSQMTFLWHLRVTLFGESQQQMVDYGARWWSWNLFLCRRFFWLPENFAHHFSPLHCRVFAPDLFCVRRQTNGLQWVGDRAIKEFQKQFPLSFRAAKVTIDWGILCIQSTRGQKRAGPANAKKRVGALLFLEQQMLLNLSFLFPEQLQTNGSRAIKRWLRN